MFTCDVSKVIHEVHPVVPGTFDAWIHADMAFHLEVFLEINGRRLA